MKFDSPLHWAAQHNQLGMVKLLLYHKAEVNVQDHFARYSPIHWAAEHASAPITRLLLLANANSNARIPDTRKSALHLAVTGKDPNNVYELLKSRTNDVLGTDWLGKTALDILKARLEGKPNDGVWAEWRAAATELEWEVIKDQSYDALVDSPVEPSRDDWDRIFAKVRAGEVNSVEAIAELERIKARNKSEHTCDGCGTGRNDLRKALKKLDDLIYRQRRQPADFEEFSLSNED